MIASAMDVVKACAREMKTFEVEFDLLPWGSEYYRREGKYMPDDFLPIIRGYDAILFGAVGAPGEFCALGFLALGPAERRWRLKVCKIFQIISRCGDCC